ncbi:hypothetical protein [Sphingopyxis sp. KK2]|uniref:hypothetical protein n=1 Tax=Sphingopyxis sp. KK2 TaxID=1855727 RepID=UPI00097E67B3|nr:hypothetical protein [Sphingopyxis sp. KK2]
MARASLVSILALLALAALGVTMLSLVGTPVGWKADDHVDRDTDAVTRGYRLEAEGGGAGLSLTCTPNEPIAVILVANAPFAVGGARHAVKIAIDDAASETRAVTIIGTSAVLADAGSADARAFVDRLAASRRVTIALAAADTGFAASFETTGADDAVGDLRHVCR